MKLFSTVPGRRVDQPVIDHERKLLFVHITRTGGTSIETLLCGQDWWRIEPKTKHLSASQARQLYGEEVWNNYTKFSVVRNPFDRVVSMWKTRWWHQSISNGNTDLKDFLLQLRPHAHEIYQSLHYVDILNEPLDHIFRFENLSERLPEVFSDKNLPLSSLPHVESREGKHYTTYYDDETRGLVLDLFARDLLAFDYRY